jgi:hypothetical protein
LTIDVYSTDDLADDNVDRVSGDYRSDDGMFLLGYFTTLYLLFSYVSSDDIVNSFRESTMSLGGTEENYETSEDSQASELEPVISLL